MTDLIPTTDSRETILRLMESVQDTYAEKGALFVRFLRERDLDAMEGLRAYAEYLGEEREGRRFATRTFNTYLAAAKNRVKLVLDRTTGLSVEQKYHIEKVMAEIKPKKINPEGVDMDRVLTFEEIDLLIEQSEDRTVSYLVEFLAYTGCRISEALGVLLSDIKQFKSSYKIRIQGKGRKERTIHVSRDLVDKMRAHFQGKRFLFEHSGKPYNRVAMTNRIKLQGRLLLGRGISAHTMRHSFATHAIKNGIDIKALSVQLGHSSTSTTADLYLHTRLSWEDYEKVFVKRGVA